MYKIFHTEGFIISSKPRKEADKFILIFTRDFGMIWAQAQGIRKLSSKLRFSLQDFSYVRVDLVRGREIWRITNATKIRSFNNIVQDPQAFKVLLNISKLLKRLINGEEKNEALFNHLIETLSFLNKEHLMTDELKDLELIIVLRILHHLGYIGDTGTAITSLLVDRSLLESIRPQRKSILAEINRSLRESQL